VYSFFSCRMRCLPHEGCLDLFFIFFIRMDPPMAGHALLESFLPFLRARSPGTVPLSPPGLGLFFFFGKVGTELPSCNLFSFLSCCVEIFPKISPTFSPPEFGKLPTSPDPEGMLVRSPVNDSLSFLPLFATGNLRVGFPNVFPPG